MAFRHYLRANYTRLSGLSTTLSVRRPALTSAKHGSRSQRKRGTNAVTHENYLDYLAFKGFVTLALGGVVGVTWAVAHCPLLSIGQRPHEGVWFGERGALSTHRAIAFLPLSACVGSGFLATCLALRFPSRVRWVEFPAGTHEIMAFPLAILIAFRFENSYNRWWSSRLAVDSVAADVISLAMSASTNTEVARLSTSKVVADEKTAKGMANHDRFMSLLNAFCIHLSVELSELVQERPDLSRILSRDDNLRCVAAADKLLWCMDSIMECIHTGQKLGQYSAELASAMYGTTCSLQQSLRVCKMLLEQKSPAPFVIHLRTFVLVFCLTFPFSIIRRVPHPTAILPVQLMLSFCLLGIEFCSREMEHPFGDDEADIPVKEIISKLRASVQRIQAFEEDRTEAGTPIFKTRSEDDVSWKDCDSQWTKGLESGSS